MSRRLRRHRTCPEHLEEDRLTAPGCTQLLLAAAAEPQTLVVQLQPAAALRLRTALCSQREESMCRANRRVSTLKEETVKVVHPGMKGG
ncbi:hypothetical protein EYF80_054699 [Liparis tanakae]|uniref:Uncharacterized protein n=1 Tax=Liparis tanakae TaxID=230148 RepID=A0A4Z2F1V6_9TELE|nr:hypothetical protein EYF80_054699 [Liparis tanakae]